MATLSTNVITLVDVAKRLNPDGSAAAIAELLMQTNGVLDDISWTEGNLSTGHRSTVRTALPTTSWRNFNEGVTPSKSTTAQIDEACGMLEAWSEVDKDLADLNGNTSAFRLSEARAFLEAMNQEFVQTLFYGNSSINPEEFTGLAPRYASTTATEAGQNVILGGGAGSDNSSLWLVCWGPETVMGIYPKGSTAGLNHLNLGEVTVETTAGIAGSRMRAYQDRWQWKSGIAVKDWRYAVRSPNIDISQLVAKSSAADLPDLMIKMYHRIPNPNMGRCAYYMNRTLFEMLDIQARDDVTAGGQLRYEVVDGRNVPTWRSYPIRIVDQLTQAETVVA